MWPPPTPEKSSLWGQDTIQAAVSSPRHSTPRYFRTGDVCHGGVKERRKERSLFTSAPEILQVRRRIGAHGRVRTKMPWEKPLTALQRDSCSGKQSFWIRTVGTSRTFRG